MATPALATAEASKQKAEPVRTPALKPHPPKVSHALPNVLSSAGNMAIQRAVAGPLHGSSAAVLTGALMSGGAKLTIGAVEDPLEHEADRVADHVMRTSDSTHSAASPGGGNFQHAPHESSKRRDLEAPQPLTRPTRPAISRKEFAHDSTAEMAPAPAIVQRVLRTQGRPLDPATQSLMEDGFGRDFSGVRVHNDAEAAQSARAINARAYTAGNHIVFEEGAYSPQSDTGQRLLAHELTHTLQQDPDAPGPIRGDFKSDFTGRNAIGVADEPDQPARSVRVRNAAGQEVWAPFGIYRPEEIPSDYQDRIMESGKAFQWRSPDLPIAEALRVEMERADNTGELTVRNMRDLSEGAGRNMNVRVMMVKVDNDFRFVGYDMSVVSGSIVTQGFVESEVGTAGVGRAMFANRVLRALQSGASEMHLEVYTSDRTASFHKQISSTAGLKTEPTAGSQYTLDTRQMARIAVAWSDELSSTQRVQLGELAASKGVVAPAQAQSIVQPTVPVVTTSTPTVGTTGVQEEEEEEGVGLRGGVRKPNLGDSNASFRSSGVALQAMAALTHLAISAIVIWSLYKIEKENEARMEEDKKNAETLVRSFFTAKSDAIADRWIDFELVYANFTTFMYVESHTWLTMSMSQAGTTPNGVGNLVKYFGSYLGAMELSDRSDVSRREYILTHTMKDGDDINFVMVVEKTSSFLEPENAVVRARIQQRIDDIDREIARSPSADNFSLQLAKHQLQLKLALFAE